MSDLEDALRALNEAPELPSWVYDTIVGELASRPARRPEDDPIIIKGHFSKEHVAVMNHQWEQFKQQTGCRRPVLILAANCEVLGAPVLSEKAMEQLPSG